MTNKCFTYFLIYALVINLSLSDLFDDNNIAEKENIQTLDYFERSKANAVRWVNNDINFNDDIVRNRRHVEPESVPSYLKRSQHRSQQDHQTTLKFKSFVQKLLRSRTKKTKIDHNLTKPSNQLIQKKNMFHKAKSGLKLTTLKPKQKNRNYKSKYVLINPKAKNNNDKFEVA
ncbi:hypothetical protein O0L34_g14107 [Tuta absoluta]|nr:hypothetical protein O0L34_g14107 [Tuta absoluta]